MYKILMANVENICHFLYILDSLLCKLGIGEFWIEIATNIKAIKIDAIEIINEINNILFILFFVLII